MDHQEDLGIEGQHDTLAKTTDAAHGLAGNLVDRRRYRSEHEGTAQTNALEDAALNPRPERLDIDHDVWKFRHRPAFYLGPGCSSHGYSICIRVEGQALTEFETAKPKEYR